MSESATAPVSAVEAIGLRLQHAAEEKAKARTDHAETKSAAEPKATDKAPEPAKPEPTAEERFKALEVELAKTKKQHSDQAKANLRLGKELAEARKENSDLKAMMQRVEQKLDGTYQDPTPQDQQKEQDQKFYEDFTRRAEMSREQAVELYGEEKVVDLIDKQDSPFKAIAAKKPYYAQRVIWSEHPNVEAIKIVEEEAVLELFGRTPDAARAKAKELVREELFQEFQKQRTGTGGKPPIAPSLSKVQGGEPAGAVSQSGKASFSAKDLFSHNWVA